MTHWTQRARDLMRDRGLSQEELAASLSCTRGAIGHYLAGRRTPSLEQLEKLAAALDADPGWLLFGESAREVREHDSAYRAGLSLPLRTVIGDGPRAGKDTVTLAAEPGRCYAVLIGSNDYEPRVHAGEAVLVDPDVEPQPGDEIILEYPDRSLRLHTLLRRDGGRVTVDNIIGEKQVRTLDRPDYRSLHRVVAIVSL